jgi:hypothetical protein
MPATLMWRGLCPLSGIIRQEDVRLVSRKLECPASCLGVHESVRHQRANREGVLSLSAALDWPTAEGIEGFCGRRYRLYAAADANEHGLIELICHDATKSVRAIRFLHSDRLRNLLNCQAEKIIASLFCKNAA